MERPLHATGSETTTDTRPRIKRRRLRQLLRRLIDIYSPTGKEEEILDYLHGYLKRHGLPVMHQAVDGHRYNILVIPPERELRLLLVGHVDTVVAYDLQHLAHSEQDQVMVGLGAADMKGGCAAMIEAFISAWESGITRPPVALALVVGEEEEGDGTKRLLRDLHVPWALIGEPTGLMPCLSHYGYLELQIVTRGKRMHASLANRGLHPVEAMLQLLLRISQYIRSKRSEVVYNIRELESSPAGFAVPERCEAWLDFHLPPSAPIGEITLDIEELIAAEPQSNPAFDGTFRFTTIHAGYTLPEKGLIVESLKHVFAGRSLTWNPQPFPSHSDANLLWAAGVKPILLGCGELEKAHAPDESVSLPQVELAAEIYLDLAMALSRECPSGRCPNGS
jgi:acetylornithine deacetylase